MDILEILESHGVIVDRIDSVPDTWADAIDRLVVDLKDLGWRGHLRSIAANDGALEVELDDEVTPAMLARIARAVDEVRHVCEECGAAAREDRPGRALCARCATLGAAVHAALDAAPDNATLGALVYELYCAWDLRRRITRFDRERESGELRTYSADEVLRSFGAGPSRGHPSRPPSHRLRYLRPTGTPSSRHSANRRSRTNVSDASWPNPQRST